MYRDLIDNAVVHLVPYIGSTFEDFGTERNCDAKSNGDDIITAFKRAGDGFEADSRVISLRKMFEMFSYAAALELDSGSEGLGLPSLVLNETEAGGAKEILDKLSHPFLERSLCSENPATTQPVLDYAYQEHATLMVR